LEIVPNVHHSFSIYWGHLVSFWSIVAEQFVACRYTILNMKASIFLKKQNNIKDVAFISSMANHGCSFSTAIPKFCLQPGMLKPHIDRYPYL